MWTSFILTNGEFRDFTQRLDQIVIQPLLLQAINNANVRVLVLDKVIVGNANGVHQVIFSPGAYELLLNLGAQTAIAKESILIPQPQDIGRLAGFSFSFGNRA